MHTLRVRPFMYFAMGIAVTAVAAWSMSAWRASAAVGADESTFVNVSPVRILDTREDLGLPGPFVSPVPQDLRVTGVIATKSGTIVVVPEGATGVLLNVTAVGPTADGFVSIRPADAPGAPTTSSLNFKAGDIIPNSVTVQVPTSGGDAGRIEITYNAFEQAGPTTEILVDLVGYTKNAGLASLQTQVNDLQTQVSQLTAAGTDAHASLQAQIDDIIAAGANVMLNGDAAGGDLAGTYPDPNLDAGSVGMAALGAVIVSNEVIPAPAPTVSVLPGPTNCVGPIEVPNTVTADGDTTLALAAQVVAPAPGEWTVEGLETTTAGPAIVRICNVGTAPENQPAIRVSLIVLGP